MWLVLDTNGEELIGVGEKMGEIKIPHYLCSGLPHMNYLLIMSKGRNSCVQLLIRQIQGRRTKMD